MNKTLHTSKYVIDLHWHITPRVWALPLSVMFSFKVDEVSRPFIAAHVLCFDMMIGIGVREYHEDYGQSYEDNIISAHGDDY